MGTFSISTRFTGQFKFVFNSRKGKIIYTSIPYDDKEECEKAIAIIKSASKESAFHKFKAAGGKFFFKILIDDIVVATSRKYSTELMLQKGINEILKYGGEAETIDFTEQDFVFPEIDFE